VELRTTSRMAHTCLNQRSSSQPSVVSPIIRIVGAGFKPAPTMHAVTGMIGATPAGERVYIAPGSAGRWPACDCRSLGEEPESTGLWPARECEGRFGMPCRVKVVPCPCCRTHLASPTGSIPGEELGVCASHTSHHLHSLSAAETQASAAS
jgi:hypothetical protein